MLYFGPSVENNSFRYAGVVQLVECLLAKEKVVGSNPIARSDKTPFGVFCINLPLRGTRPTPEGGIRPL